MNDQEFDAATTAVAGTQTRRQTLRMLGGLSLAGILGYTEAAARAKKHHGHAGQHHGQVEEARKRKKGKKGKGKGKKKHHGGRHGGRNGGGATVPPQPGFTVSGRQILTPAGNPVLLRGINKMFLFEEGDPTGQTILPQIALSQANTVRIVWGIRNDKNQATDVSVLDQLISNSLANGLLPMIELHDATGDFGQLYSLVDYWTRPEVVNVINAHSQALLVNIGNEVGDDTVDANQFISGYTNAVQRMRNANIHTPLVIDAPDFGKNLDVLNASAQTLLDADPDHNLIFSVHLYWGINDGATPQVIADKLNAAVALNYPLIVGEFSQWGAFNGNQSVCQGNGEVDYKTIVEQTRQQGIGWYAWEWGPGNAFGDAGCDKMDMTTDGQFANLKNGWARDVAIDLPGSIRNTSTRIV
jgi:mannan endo-1,4-beta-mannosidase